jgi:two-component system sensor histidine kinase ChiS
VAPLQALVTLALAALLLASCARELRDIEGPVGFDTDVRPVSLQGGWERFAGFQDEASLRTRGGSGMTVAAPLVSPLFFPADTLAGPVTYRIRIALPQAPATYALFLPGAGAYSSISANGQTIFLRGRDQDPGDELRFLAAGPELSLLIQSPRQGPRLEDPGIVPRPFLFGSERVIRSFHLVGLGLAVFQAGFFVLAALLVFSLFLFWRKNRDFLALSFLLLAAGAFTVSKTGSFFGLFALSRSYLSFASIETASLLVAALALFLAACFTTKFSTLARLPAFFFPLLFMAGGGLLFWLPEAERWLYAAVSAWYLVFALVVLLWLLVLSVKRDPRARWLLPALTVAALAIGGHRFFEASLLAGLYAVPAGLMVFAFIAMLMLVKKISDSFESSATLTDYVANVSTTMKRFIPEEFLQILDKEDVTDLRLGDHVRKEMTIFFSDIRAFTELSERLTVEENFAFINSYLSRIVPIIDQGGGFVDKYMGDGIMALFPGERGPDAAIRAAINMQVKMVEYNGHRANTGYRPISMGVGVHTGTLMLGVIGVDSRMENTVISDAVNLTSRLQAITKAFNISLAISEQAFKELEDPGVYKYRFIGKVRVKGKAAPVSVFEIFDGIAPELFERKMKANTYFEQGMLSYYQKDFGGAMYYFKRVLEIIPEDGAASFYLENCINKASL